jgi:hypothetical protein
VAYSCRRLGVLAVLGTLAVAAPAAAHDDLGPPGAGHAWLPQEAWVLEHWMPFDRAPLERALGLRGSQLESYLFNDHHTLAELARRRGVDVDDLADQLVAPWQPLVAGEQVAVLRERTIRVLTQGHLAQHMFFHVFHSFPIGATVAQRLFGVSEGDLDSLRKRRLSPAQIASSHGVAEPDLIAGLAAVLHDRRAAAALSGQAWPTESDRLLERQMQVLPCWVRSLRPTNDHGNPYGKATRVHGAHAAGWPATASERRRNERRAERVRRRLRPTCWPAVAAWRWHPGAPARPALCVTQARHGGEVSRPARRTSP